STTYVTFMVFMGTSLADGAWSRESAVYRVSGVISVVGGWFFTALAAFTAAFILACIFYFGGPIAIGLVLVFVAVLIYRSHRYHGKRMDDQLAFEQGLDEGTMTNVQIVELAINNMTIILDGLKNSLDNILDALAAEDLPKLNKVNQKFKEIIKRAEKIKRKASKALDKISDDQIEAIHLYMLVADYLSEMTSHGNNIIKDSLDHVDNNHKPLVSAQIEELSFIQDKFKIRMDSTIEVFKNRDSGEAKRLQQDLQLFVKAIRTARKNQIKRIRDHEVGTRNSVLYLHLLGEYRNLSMFSDRLVKVLDELILDPVEDQPSIRA
ncbi:MAG: hypothetical protein HKN68_19540, partial [Saprospiraceae bacterium]|nr:hypothetical protein [Saprospiraceae bacterium]